MKGVITATWRERLFAAACVGAACLYAVEGSVAMAVALVGVTGVHIWVRRRAGRGRRQVIGVPWDQVHSEAEVLEHAISARLEERVDALLNHPTHDPHDDPIPPTSAEHVEDWPNPLAMAPAGARFLVERVSDRDSDILRHLASLGVGPGVVLSLIEWAPFGGPLLAEVDGRKRALGSELVRVIHGRTI